MGNNNNGLLKGILLVLVALYVISPVDFVPGPVDDLLLILFTLASGKNRGGNTNRLPYDVYDPDDQD